MDLDSARGALVQESRELLIAMEAGLLDIEQNGMSTDAINAVFRAAHTIKGSAGLFALDHIVSFTHVMENVLDRVRSGRLGLDEQMLSVLLASGDYLSKLIDGIDAQRDDIEPDAPLRALLLQQLSDYLPNENKDVVATAKPEPAVEVMNAERGGSDSWHISLRLSPDVLRSGMDPLSFLRYLGKLGRIVYMNTLTETLPAAAEFDPETLYLGFEIEFESEADKQTIENVFEFVREESVIRILPPHSKVDAYVAHIKSLPEEPQLLGEILVACGALTRTELEHVLGMQSDAPGQKPPIGTLLVEEQVVHPGVVSAALTKQQEKHEKKQHEQRFIKVDVDKLDALINLVGELVIAGAAAQLAAKTDGSTATQESTATVGELVENIRDAALSLRMVPIGEVFQRYPRVVRDISKDLGKKIELVISGAETELDKSMVEKLADPLTHIVRNAIDHGIESVERRQAAGKPATGTLRLHAYHDSGSIAIEISDDGAGLNKERIRNKGIERGLITAEQQLSDQEIYRLIFEPGFSTAEQITNLSGRGVGMDVVRKNIDALRGEVEVESREGEGATVRIRLPLTLAIIDGFQVSVAGAAFVLPLEMVKECADLIAADVYRNLVSLRGEPLPFIRLRELFAVEGAQPQRESLVVVQYGGQRVGLVVDSLVGELQAVIKPLGALFRDMRGISGSTILGNGQVALILDVPNLAHSVTAQHVTTTSQSAPRALSSTH
ncbi:chemotaxis protein CheA [Permianibacter sp. IMCC34836]|uniref:chemotaxis protein CheA n=1 Tax=Permianibacter fluminis TaxID=2738515 RepID=UPI001556F038|nr:chemotaxis protein CheA [Permianibacter fluminis]NQD36147.1 chemotaxis protein CheA [Permianibacter fluminis]